eukprot:SAG22_NODE_7022_length_785_cov_0.771137_1_plen_182_part_00
MPSAAARATTAEHFCLPDAALAVGVLGDITIERHDIGRERHARLPIGPEERREPGHGRYVPARRSLVAEDVGDRHLEAPPDVDRRIDGQDDEIGLKASTSSWHEPGVKRRRSNGKCGALCRTASSRARQELDWCSPKRRRTRSRHLGIPARRRPWCIRAALGRRSTARKGTALHEKTVKAQ